MTGPDAPLFRFTVTEPRVLSWDDLTGPGLIPCENRCEVPDGVRLEVFPESRHAWPGFVNCPHGCGRSFCLYISDADQDVAPKDVACAGAAVHGGDTAQ